MNTIKNIDLYNMGRTPLPVKQVLARHLGLYYVELDPRKVGVA
jgi:hypothetical protein